MASIPVSRFFRGFQNIGKGLGGFALVLTATAQLIELILRLSREKDESASKSRKER
jgi:hypothetical protein